MRREARLTLVAETVHHTRNDVADAAPDWLVAPRDPTWAEPCDVRGEAYRRPKDARARRVREPTIGQDGFALRDVGYAPDAPSDRWQRPCVQMLRQIWLPQYVGPHNGRWRSGTDRPPHAHLMTSPYATAACVATKRQSSWTGYQGHLTEPGDDDTPHRSTHGETTPATTHDVGVTTTIHDHVAVRGLLPAEHLWDTGSVAADGLVASKRP